MTGLLLLLGESFRSGSQGSRIRGRADSVPGQMAAAESHLRLAQKCKMDIFIGTYNTPYNQMLIDLYQPTGQEFLDTPIGLTQFFHHCLKKIQITKYEYIFFVRIDLCFKPWFYDIFSPQSTITYPSICWFRHSVTSRGHPRVNDTMLFIPQKYFGLLRFIEISHDSWQKLMLETQLTPDDIDTFLKSYHDSDSQKDFNPIYFIVNRPQSRRFHSYRRLFVKQVFYRPQRPRLFDFRSK